MYTFIICLTPRQQQYYIKWQVQSIKYNQQQKLHKTFNKVNTKYLILSVKFPRKTLSSLFTVLCSPVKNFFFFFLLINPV